jgi:signal transduction histidine kinase
METKSMLKNVKIRQQINLLVVVIGGLVIVLAGVYLLLLAQISVQSDRSTDLHEAALGADKLANATQYMAYNTSSYSLGHFQNREEFNEHIIEFDIAFADILIHKNVLTDQELIQLDRVGEIRVEYEQAALTLFETTGRLFTADSEEERRAEQAQQDEEWKAQDLMGRRLDIILSDFSFDVSIRAQDADAIRAQTIQVANGVGFILPVLVIGLSIFITFAIRNAIVNPIKMLTDATSRFSKQDYSHRLAVQSRNEFGDLSNSFNKMADAIQQQIDEIEKARERAEQSEQVKAAFLASMSHELRTPLNAVINFTRFVVEGDTGPVNEQQKELLTEVVGSGKHLLSLINDVLDMSKIEANSLNLFIEDGVDVTAIINNAMTTARALLGDKPVELSTAVTENLPPMRADRQRILQILLNIVSNACKFTEAGQIKLRAYAVDDELVISVEDTGQGIAAEDQELVFEAFKQTGNGLREGGGTGLGMPIARSLTEAHGGHIWLESTLGQGTTFYVSLPVKAETLQPALN